MFFRREKPRKLTFSDRLDSLRQAGFSVTGSQVSKHGSAAVLEDRGEDTPGVRDVGVLVGGEIANLVNGGFQQFFITKSGKRYPALAEQLHALHDFQEDLKEGLGDISLYNQSLGTTSTSHMYDRVKGRDL